MNGESLYFHIPFCQKKCPYCHFYVIKDDESQKDLLLDALKKEWEQKSPLLTQGVVSIYFGGGTPSLFGPHRIEKILNLLPWTEECEITLEGNPDDLTLESLKDYKKLGINRLSIGVQSLDNHLLQRLGRTHTAEKAVQAVSIARDVGFENISCDFMYDIPNQTMEVWEETLGKAALLPITHVSLYNLTIEPGTPFDRVRKHLEKKVPCEEVSKNMFYAAGMLEEYGFKRYEISAFARDEKISKHNTGYWTARPFLGLGPSAFSYWGGKRFRNIADLSQYCSLLDSGKAPVDFEEELSEEKKRRELLVLELRLMRGASKEKFLPLYPEMRKLMEQGLLREDEGQIFLTEQGMITYDFVAAELI